MNNDLAKVLDHIGDTYHGMIDETSRHYIEINVGKVAETLGYADLKTRHGHHYVVVPIKAPVPGMKVRIDGRTFVNYYRHSSGFAIPAYLAKAAGVEGNVYIPNDSMILNVA